MDRPKLWIQWKGTDLCADFHCSCGYFGHIDNAAFLYFLKCPHCGQIFENPNDHQLIAPTRVFDPKQVYEVVDDDADL